MRKSSSVIPAWHQERYSCARFLFALLAADLKIWSSVAAAVIDTDTVPALHCLVEETRGMHRPRPLARRLGSKTPTGICRGADCMTPWNTQEELGMCHQRVHVV